MLLANWLTRISHLESVELQVEICNVLDTLTRGQLDLLARVEIHFNTEVFNLVSYWDSEEFCNLNSFNILPSLISRLNSLTLNIFLVVIAVKGVVLSSAKSTDLLVSTSHLSSVIWSPYFASDLNYSITFFLVYHDLNITAKHQQSLGLFLYGRISTVLNISVGSGQGRNWKVFVVRHYRWGRLFVWTNFYSPILILWPSNRSSVIRSSGEQPGFRSFLPRTF